MAISDLFANGATPNIVIIITDQERDLSEWPKSYQQTLASKLPARQRLMASGLSFDNAYTGACMCSSARATFLTSQYPIVTGCTRVGGQALPLPATFPNIATVLARTQYRCYWIGKWHLLAPEPGSSADDLEPWGFSTYTPPGDSSEVAWDPPDAGLSLGTTTLGGGTRGPALYNQNDQRYVADAQAFLASPPTTGPWCLVISLVNPHDVHLGYLDADGTYYDRSLYQDEGVPIPTNADQRLSTMPRGQGAKTWNGSKQGGATQQDFVNFYSYLVQYVDELINDILDTMESQGLLDGTLVIRYADHGEMGLSHGLVEKFVSAYGESTHVPLVFSNPTAYPSAQTTSAMASTVDLAPTLASLLGVSDDFPDFVGTDLSPVLEDPSQSVQEYVHFTYDDIAGPGPSVIRTIRSEQWVYSVYLDSVTSATSGYVDADWEMYDLSADPSESRNVAGTHEYATQQLLLDQILQDAMKASGTAPAWYPDHWPPTATSHSRGGSPPPELPIARVAGIDAEQAVALQYVGIRTTADLLRRGATAEQREVLAGLVPVDPKTLEQWVTDAERQQREVKVG